MWIEAKARPSLRWPRWDTIAALGLLALLGAAVGARPDLSRKLGQAVWVVRTIRGADAVAHDRPADSARRWDRLRAVRTDDDAFVALVWSNLLRSRRWAQDGVGLRDDLEQARRLPAFAAGEPVLLQAVGYQLLRGGDAAGARDVLSAGLLSSAKLDDTAVRLRSTLAAALASLGDARASEQVMSSLVAAQPGESWLAVNLALSWADRSDNLDAAEAAVRRALLDVRLEPWRSLDVGAAAREQRRADRSAYQDALGWILYRQGRTSEGLKLLRTAYETPSDASAVNLYHLGSAYYDQGRDGDALVCAKLALERDASLIGARQLIARLERGAAPVGGPT